MQTTLHPSYPGIYTRSAARDSLWKRFINWTDRQEEWRFGWVAGILVGHGCFFTIITMMAILFTGNHFIFWPFAISAMAICVVVNLAAMPTRITIPVFFFSVLMDLVVIAICLTNGFDISASYR